MNGFRLAVFVSVLLSWSPRANAVGVAIVRPTNPSSRVTETLIRLQGELLAVGIGVELADGAGIVRRDAAVPPAWLKELAEQRRVDAVIDFDVAADRSLVAVQIWISDQASHRWEVSKVPLEASTENASERLAIRSIEVLRSSLLERDLTERRRRGEIPPAPTTSAPPPDDGRLQASRPPSWGLEVGAVALTSLSGVGVAVLPLARLDWSARPWLTLQAAAAGLGSHPMVVTTTGNARVSQQYGVLGGCYRFLRDARVHPLVALAAGALRTSVEGRADLPQQGHSLEQWSFLLDGSLGAEVPLGSRTYATLAAHAQVAEPYVAIHFLDREVATSGRPNLLLTLTLGVWL